MNNYFEYNQSVKEREREREREKVSEGEGGESECLLIPNRPSLSTRVSDFRLKLLFAFKNSSITSLSS
jgi:hypothetical protein